MARGSFAHLRLDAYRVGLDLLEGVYDLVEFLPRGTGDLRDQLSRCAFSIVRHVAEAAGRTTAADRRARFTVARGECAELDACLEVALRLRFVEAGRIEALRDLTDRMGAMLTGLTRRESQRLKRK